MPKKQDFLVKIFQKVPKNAFFGLFFHMFACAKTGTKSCLGRAQKINSVDLQKKGLQNFLKLFENPHPPRENRRSAPALAYAVFS